MKAPFGWTVIRDTSKPDDPNAFKVYQREEPSDEEHFAADLAPYTHATKALAIAAGKRGEYAYKQA
jgi:hypothetical protein